MKVLQFIPVYAPAWQFGGPVQSVSRLSEALADANNQVSVITTDTGLSNILDFETDENCKTINLNGVRVNYYRSSKAGISIDSNALKRDLPQALQGADIIHMSAIWQPLGINVQRAAYELNIPVLHSIRGALGTYSRQSKWWKKAPYYWLRERPWLQKSAGIHVTSLQERKEVESLKLRAPCYLLPNPIDLFHLQPDSGLREQWRKDHQINLETPLLLICGRQHHKKGLDLIPPILQSLGHLDWKLLIVGSDDDGSGKLLELEFRNRGLYNRLTVLPSQPTSKLCEIYNAADLLLLPSRHENFGNVVIEALACGCSVLISDRTGVCCDLLSSAPKDFGAVLPRESQSWVNWLETWLHKHQRAGTKSALWAAQRFSSTTVAKQAMAIYQEILNARRQ